MSQSCSSCRFFQVHPGAVNQGICKRYPPTGAAVPQQTQTPVGPRMEIQQIAFYPPVKSQNWCGEYVGKPKPENN